MTQTELNVQIWRNIAEIADDEPLMEKLAKYLKKLVKERLKDPSEMTKEEFFARVDESKAQYLEGKYNEILPNEDLTTYLKRRGYDI